MCIFFFSVNEGLDRECIHDTKYEQWDTKDPFAENILESSFFFNLGETVGEFSFFYPMWIGKEATFAIPWHFRRKVALWTAEWRKGWWFYHWAVESDNAELHPTFASLVKKANKKTFIFFLKEAILYYTFCFLHVA